MTRSTLSRFSDHHRTSPHPDRVLSRTTVPELPREANEILAETGTRRGESPVCLEVPRTLNKTAFRERPPQEDNPWRRSAEPSPLHPGINLTESPFPATERNRLARDIHDSSGQHIVAVLLKLSALEADCKDPVLRAGFADMRAILTQLSQELHDIIMGSRSGLPIGRTLVSALENVIDQWTRLVPICFEFHRHLEPGITVADEVAEAVFRIVQESLTNIAAHAPTATLVRVSLKISSKEIEIEVEDDGPGFDRPRPTEMQDHHNHSGIAGMISRLAPLGGTLTVRTREEGGTHLRASIPRRRRRPWGAP